MLGSRVRRRGKNKKKCPSVGKERFCGGGLVDRSRWATKKTRPYLPLNPGWLIGILIMVHYNPLYTITNQGFFHCSDYFFSHSSMVQWKLLFCLKGNDPIGDTPIFHWTMIMGRRWKKDIFFRKTILTIYFGGFWRLGYNYSPKTGPNVLGRKTQVHQHTSGIGMQCQTSIIWKKVHKSLPLF